MRNKTRLFGIYLPFFILILLGAITLRTIALIRYFNYDYHYFSAKVIPTIADALVLFVIFFFLIYIIGIKKKINLIPSFSSPANYIPSATLSAALVFIAIDFARSFLYSTSALIRFLSLPLAILAVLSIAYLVMNTVFVRTVSARRATFGLAIIIFLALYLSYLYFDSKAPISSPIKTVDQLVYAFGAVFFLYEIRLSLGREKWKAYLIFGFIAAALAVYSAVPALIVYFVNGEVVANSIHETILTLAIFIFIASKLILVDKLTDAGESPFITKLKKAAADREEELNPKANTEATEKIDKEESESDDLNQISILDTKRENESSALFEENQRVEIQTDSEDSIQ